MEPGAGEGPGDFQREVHLATTTELGHRLRAGPSHVWQRLNDWWLNIDTAYDPSASPDACEREGADDYRAQYQGANYLYLEQIARLVTREAPGQLVFYDIGCGKGRPLCVMARHPFRKVVGVEVREDLAQIARANAHNVRRRMAPIEVVCADARAVDYSDGDVFFLFNPFGPPTLQRVVDSLERSLTLAPRDVTLIYYHALHEAVLKRSRWLECYGRLPTYSGLRISFWRNRNQKLERRRGIA